MLTARHAGVGACAERDACRNEVGCLSREADRLHSRCRELAASVQVSPAQGCMRGWKVPGWLGR